MTTPQYALAPDLRLALLSASSLGATAAERGELHARRTSAALTAGLAVLAGAVALFDATLLLGL